MDDSILSSIIENGTIYLANRSERVSALTWQSHPVFKGVHLKHMIKSADTGGRFSSHLVRIDTGCILSLRCHDSQCELHEVIQGDGVCRIADALFDYHPGKMAVKCFS